MYAFISLYVVIWLLKELLFFFFWFFFFFNDSKGIIVLLNKGQKLDESNYSIWHCKVQNVLDEQKVLEILTQSLTTPNNGDNPLKIIIIIIMGIIV